MAATLDTLGNVVC